MGFLNVNKTAEALKIGAALKLAKRLGFLTDAIIVASGVKQVERMTVVGSVGGSGGGTIIVNFKTSQRVSANLWNGGAGKNISVTLVNSETATQSAARVRTALDLDADVAAAFAAAGGTGANVDMTSLLYIDEDTVMNISYTLGTATGPTAVPTSTTVTAGAGVNTLISTIEAAALPRGASDMERKETSKAIRNLKSLGVLTDAVIGPLTTVDQIIALTGVPAGVGGAQPYL